MRKIPMQDIWVTYDTKRILVSAGWMAYVPEMTPDYDDLRAYAEVYREEVGGDYDSARKAAHEALMKEYISCRMWKLSVAIQYWCRRYLKLHPKALTYVRFKDQEGHFIARGFDPEKIQLVYLPFDNVGRAGKPYATKLLDQMYQTCKGVSN